MKKLFAVLIVLMTVSIAHAGPMFGGGGQPYSQNLVTFSEIAPSENMVTFLGSADYSAMRTNMGVAIGTDVQAQNALITQIAALTGTSAFIGFNSSGSAATITKIAIGNDTPGQIYDTASGSTSNSQCTAASTPAACCTGNGTGSCTPKKVLIQPSGMSAGYVATLGFANTADAVYTFPPATSTLLATTGSGASLTGLLNSQMPVPTTTVNTSRSVAENAEYVICTNTCTVTPLVPVAGRQLCVRNAPGSATVITLANITDVYYEKTDHTGWQANANYKLVSGADATASICLVGYDATHYAVWSYTGTWTHTAP